MFQKVNKKTSLSEENEKKSNELDLFDVDKDTLAQQLSDDYDQTIEIIIDKAIGVSCQNSFFNVGLFQFVSFLFIATVSTIVNGWYGYSIVFVGYSPPHECLIKTNASDYLTRTGDQCTLLNSTSNVTVDCTKWKYDQSQMRTTMITEYDFVCKRSYFLEVAYSLEQCGYVLGVFVFSRSADKKGRKPIFVSILFCIAVLGLVQYFVTNFYAYMSLGFVINFFASGLDPVTMPLIVEMFQAKKRAVFGIGFGYVWVVVITLLAPLAYILNTWRELKLLIFIILAIFAVSSIWLIEESLTWLISTNKISRAKQVLDKMSKINRLADSDSFTIKRAKLDVILDDLESFNNAKNHSKAKSSLADMVASTTITNVCCDVLRNGKFCVYVSIIIFNALTVGLVYDGITLLNAAIGENIFINWVIMNMVELPAQILCYYLVSRIGRRLPSATFFILGGISLLLNSLNYTESIKSIAWIKLILFVVSKLSIGITFGIQMLHMSEIFPTNMRSFGIGFGVIAYEITAVIAPMISLYMTKVLPWLPLVIYGTLSVLSGFSYLYLPETLNRPLPNSIADVVKWPRKRANTESSGS